MRDVLDEGLRRVVEAQAATSQPAATFAALDGAFAAIPGHRLFTVLLHDRPAGCIRRAYSNQPAAYPTGGFKPIVDSPWMRQVLGEGRPYIGRDRDDIRSVFFDHELIVSLGCESVLNIPVRWRGCVAATLNLLHAAHWYDAVDPETLVPLAQAALPAILTLARP